MMAKLSEFWANESGASPFTEYGLLTGVVSMVGIFSWTVIGTSLQEFFTGMSSTLSLIVP